MTYTAGTMTEKILEFDCNSDYTLHGLNKSKSTGEALKDCQVLHINIENAQKVMPYTHTDVMQPFIKYFPCSLLNNGTEWSAVRLPGS